MGDGENRKLYVANLPQDVVEAQIRQVFSLYGDLEEVYINPPKEYRVERSAFVRFQEQRDASAAAAVLHEMYTFPGCNLPVAINYANQRPDASKMARRDDGYRNFASNNDRGGSGGWKTDSWSSDWHNSGKGGSRDGSGDSYGYNNRGYNDRGDGGYGERSSYGERQSYNDRSSFGDRQPYNDQRDQRDQRSYNDRQVEHKGAPPPPPSAHGGDRRDPAGKLWVGNLPADVTTGALEQVFGTYGKLAEVSLLPCKSKTGQMCAFVHYVEGYMADTCLAAMEGGYEMKPGEGQIRVERPGANRKSGVDFGKGGGKYAGGACGGGGFGGGCGGGCGGDYGKGGYRGRYSPY